jgi:hypothetical protein
MRIPHRTVIRSDVELLDLWQILIGAGGFAKRSLWLLFLDEDGRPQPVIVPIDDIPERPECRLIDSVASIVAGLTSTGEVASVALLLSRPGPQQMTDDDRTWARALRAHETISRRWPIHLATTDHMQAFGADDLVPSGAG